MGKVVQYLILTLAVSICSSVHVEGCVGTKLEGHTLNPSNYGDNRPNVTVTIKSGSSTIATPSSDAGGYWTYCDGSSLGNYSINFSILGTSYDFVWISDNDGVINVRDFGTVGDGIADDRRSIHSAIYFTAGNNGGKIIFPKGYYKVSEGFLLPSGTVIEGTNGYGFSSCRLELTAQNKYLFKIGDSTNGISITNILLTTSFGSTGFLSGTKGIYAAGSYPNSSIGLVMRDLTLSGFEIGIDVLGLDTNKDWQFDNVRLDHVGLFCKECIRIETTNSDWHLSNVFIGTVKDGFGINILKSGSILIESTVAGGPFYYIIPGDPPTQQPVPIGSSEAADTFINVAGPHGLIKVDSSRSEQFRNYMVVDYADYAAPIMVSNSTVGDSVIFKKNATFVSSANTYLSDSFETWVSGQPRAFVDGTPFSKRMVRGNCPVPDQSCCSEQTVGNPSVGTADNVKIYSFGDHFFNFNRFWCTNSFAEGTYPQDFIVSGNSAVYGSRTNTVFEKNVGVGSLKPGAGLSGTPSVLEVESRNGDLPWLIMNRAGATSGNRRWGWVVGSDGSLYLQDIGYGNRIQIDTSGNLVPPSDNTGQIGTSSQRWAKVRATIIEPGDIVLTDIRTGEPLYVINEDKDNIYFKDSRTGKLMMRLDRTGNLYIKGKLYEGGDKSVKSSKQRKVSSRRSKKK